MENKNPKNNLKNTATLTKFEEIIGKVSELKSQNEVANRINERLKEQISLLEDANQRLEQQNKELRRELKQEKKRSDAKVNLDEFNLQIASVMKKVELGEIKADETWKALFDALIIEVENCIQLVQHKQSLIE